MRHRRIRQAIYYKYGKNKIAKDLLEFKLKIGREHFKNFNKVISNLENGNEYFVSCGVLDPTFKWHRNYGEYWFSHISYGDKDSEYPFWCEIVHIKDWKDKEDKRRCER